MIDKRVESLPNFLVMASIGGAECSENIQIVLIDLTCKDQRHLTFEAPHTTQGMCEVIKRQVPLVITRLKKVLQRKPLLRKHHGGQRWSQLGLRKS